MMIADRQTSTNSAGTIRMIRRRANLWIDRDWTMLPLTRKPLKAKNIGSRIITRMRAGVSAADGPYDK